MTCYIIEDQQHAIDLLVMNIEQTPGLRLLGYETDPFRALEKIRAGQMKADIFFMDVKMPGMSGLDLAAFISAQSAVIFTTAHSGFASVAYELDAVDYLVKPVSAARFLLAVTRAERRLGELRPAGQHSREYLFIPGNGKSTHYRILMDSIRYVKGDSSYSHIYTTEEGKNDHYTHYPVKDLQKVLNQQKFIRVHRSYIVSIGQIKLVSSQTLLLENEYEVPVGETYKKEVWRRLGLR